MAPEFGIPARVEPDGELNVEPDGEPKIEPSVAWVDVWVGAGRTALMHGPLAFIDWPADVAP